MDVVVIGCGVIGLTTAVRLQEAGFKVHIRTSALPRGSTSIVAAAVWYPYKAYPEDKVLKWAAESYEIFQKIAADPTTGVKIREGVEILRETAPVTRWQSALPGFRRCACHELPAGCHDGYVFAAPVVEMPVYLHYLLNRFSVAGGSVERRRVSSLEEVADERRCIVVNCTGLGARKLAADNSVFPIRGQISRVSNPGLTRFLLDEAPEGITYVVPRSTDCVLGGTAEEGEWGTEADAVSAAGILGRVTVLEPRLKEATVLEHRVGLRPGRPEIRLESDGAYGDVPVIHNYGHGGSGVTLSWGCAEEVLRLVRAMP